MSDYTPLFIAIFFIVIAFVVAMNKGVVGLLASGTAAACGMGVILAGMEFLPSLTKTYLDIDLDWKFSLALTAGLAFVVFLISRITFAIFFKWLFNPDGLLHSLVDGIPGGILSIFPSLVTVFIFFTCIRAAGTVQELNYIDSLSQNQIREMGGKIPGYPVTASWRNAVESVPFLPEALDATDPFSRRAARNAAAFVLAQDGVVLRPHLVVSPETGSLAELPVWRTLTDDPRVAAALIELDRIGLVTAPALQAVIGEGTLAADLEKVDFKETLEKFVTSLAPAPLPDRSEIITP